MSTYNIFHGYEKYILIVYFGRANNHNIFTLLPGNNVNIFVIAFLLTVNIAHICTHCLFQHASKILYYMFIKLDFHRLMKVKYSIL